MLYVRVTLVAALMTACGAEQVQSERTTAEPPSVRTEQAIIEASPASGMLADAVPMASAPVAAEPERESQTTYPTYSLRRGETLAHFSRWSEVPVEEIADASDLDLDGLYPVGTSVTVPVVDADRERLDSLREEHAQRRVDGYLASRGGSVGVGSYRVRTGDSAWSVARDQSGIPVWLIEAYNPDIDLDRLRPGMELSLPVLADTVVDASVLE